MEFGVQVPAEISSEIMKLRSQSLLQGQQKEEEQAEDEKAKLAKNRQHLIKGW